MLPEFEPFPKVPRYNREIVVTEKIDGTNASVHWVHEESIEPEGLKPGYALGEAFFDGQYHILLAASRKRWIHPGNDNYGFAKWVQENAEGLEVLGPGAHFGEWWGQGIQRRYGLNENLFSFNP